jgi:hypothetical protein
LVDKPTPTPRRGYLYHKALSMAEEQEAKPGELRGAASRPAPPRFGSVSCRAAAALVRGKGPERFGVFPSENGSVGIGLDGGVIWPPPHSSGKRFASRKSTIVRKPTRSGVCGRHWSNSSAKDNFGHRLKPRVRETHSRAEIRCVAPIPESTRGSEHAEAPKSIAS